MRLVRALVLSVLMVTAVACGGSDKADRGDTAATAAPAPEEQRASAAAVAAGLKQIDEIATRIAAAGADKAKAAGLDQQIEPAWQQIEGTVKANDKDAYIAFEDSFAVLEGAAKHGDAATGHKGAKSVSDAVTAYLAKFPG